MGIQVTVELSDLRKAGWKFEEVAEPIIVGEDEIGNAITKEHHYLVVEVPGVGKRASYSTSAFVFDNKNANMDIRKALELSGVPYVRA